MEERWEFSPVDAGSYCGSQLPSNVSGGPGYNEFRRLLSFCLVVWVSITRPASTRLSHFFHLLQPRCCCPMSRLLCFQFKAALS
jgi:hypothetical protein